MTFLIDPDEETVHRAQDAALWRSLNLRAMLIKSFREQHESIIDGEADLATRMVSVTYMLVLHLCTVAPGLPTSLCTGYGADRISHQHAAALTARARQLWCGW